jgi:hypothetical protein
MGNLKTNPRKNQKTCHSCSVSDARSIVITPCQKTTQCTRTMPSNKMQDLLMQHGRKSRKQAYQYEKRVTKSKSM